MNQRRMGEEKEELACHFLEKQGYEILARNYWCRRAELDIVAMGADGVLVFVEVKYRKNGACGGSLYAITEKKRQNMIYAAKYYIYREGVLLDAPMRFDVIAIDDKTIQHIQDAFQAE